MDPVAVVVGLSLLSLLIVFFAFNIDEEHFLLKLLLLFVFMASLVLIPKSILDQKDHCGFVVTSSTVSGGVTSFTYDYLCSSNPKTTGLTLLKIVYAFITSFCLYVFVYLVYHVLDWFGYIPWKSK